MSVHAEIQIEAVVFDLDGLMLNTEDVFHLSGCEMLARRGLEMTEEIHRSMLGRRPNEAFQAMKDLTGIADSIDLLKEETRTLFSRIAETSLSLMPGLADLLTLLEELQLPKAVATSSPRDYVQDLLSRFDLVRHFPLMLTAEDVQFGKPHPEIYLAAAERLNVIPERMLVLEDSETGTKAAAAAGAITVSVPNRHTVQGDFSMATLQVDSLAAPELLQLIRPIEA